MHRRGVLTGLALGALWTAGGCDTSPRPAHAPGRRPASTAATLANAGTVIATVPAGDWADAMAVDDGTLWVANYQDATVTRIDMRLRAATTTIDVGRSPFSMAVAAGAVWVANSHGKSVSRIDVATNRETARLALAADPDSLGVVDNVLWIAGSDENAYLFSLTSHKLIATVPIGVRSGRCLVRDGALWLTDFLGGSQSAVRVDARTHKTTLKVVTGHNPIAVTFGFDAGWIANGLADSTVTRFDPQTGQVQATISIPGSDAAGIQAGPEGVWVASYATGYVYRIDPTVNRVTAGVRIGEAAQDIVISDGLLWVTDSAGKQVAVVQPEH